MSNVNLAKLDQIGPRLTSWLHTLDEMSRVEHKDNLKARHLSRLSDLLHEVASYKPASSWASADRQACFDALCAAMEAYTATEPAKVSIQ
jgi:hypothetical protein